MLIKVYNLKRTFVLFKRGDILERTILHCDLNNFYASVACRDNPELKGKPVAVCGRKEERHGIVLAKNQLAKSFGVTTGEAIWQAKSKCKNLIIVEPNFKRYIHFSNTVRKIYERYTDQIEPFGIDECWLDVTGSRLLFGDGKTIADDIRETVKEETRLTISVGVSFNKVFAKLGSDLKKPDATTVISKENFKDIVWPLPVSYLLMVGKSTANALEHIGVLSIGDLALIAPSTLVLKLGKSGNTLSNFARGLDQSPVAKSDYTPIPKSIGRSVTCSKDLVSLEQIQVIILQLCEDITKKLRLYGLSANGVQVHLRKSNLTTHEFQAPLLIPTQLTTEIYKKGMELIKRNFSVEYPLRSVGIRAINLSPYNTEFQISFFDNLKKRESLKNIETSIDKIREKFGEQSIFRASLMQKTNADFDFTKPTIEHPLGNTYKLL